MDLLQDLVPRLSMEEAGRLFGRSGRWKNFAFRAQKNEAIRNLLLERQQGRCACCDRKLKPRDLVGHHISYEQVCRTDRQVRGRKERRGKSPPCHDCGALEDCARHLVGLCRLCHRRVHSPEHRSRRGHRLDWDCPPTPAPGCR